MNFKFCKLEENRLLHRTTKKNFFSNKTKIIKETCFDYKKIR